MPMTPILAKPEFLMTPPILVFFTGLPPFAKICCYHSYSLNQMLESSLVYL